MKITTTNDCAPYCNGCRYKFNDLGGAPYCGYEFGKIPIGAKDGSIGYYYITGRVIARGLRCKTICPFFSKER